MRKKVGGKQAAREELARLKANATRQHVTGPNFDAVRHALSTVEEVVAALRDQVATSKAREQIARSALARLLETVNYFADTDDTMAAASAAAQQVLDQLYTDSH
ncbi:MAG: hypothetical protein J0I12_27930 [Candidatus Eremiobacteraeota bacterium]|nr:hypothetical protein [Candidatus Eremiobacteraeota bacterium]